VPIDHGLWERILGESADTRIPEEQAGNDPLPEGRATLLGGWISCAIGVLLAAGTVFAAFLGGGANISAGALGVGFGVLGYFLGTRKLATATVFLCAAAILFALAASQGLVPGIAPSDRALPNLSSLF
jgi:VIT1/CCC1 family predicted Fe2+/Mn2+ transporter